MDSFSYLHGEHRRSIDVIGAVDRIETVDDGQGAVAVLLRLSLDLSDKCLPMSDVEPLRMCEFAVIEESNVGKPH